MFRKFGIFMLLFCASLALADEMEIAKDGSKKVLIYGASGRIGSAIAEEALLRGYEVTGVSRDASRLDQFEGRIEVQTGDILDRAKTANLIAEHDAVIVSVGGRPSQNDPAKNITVTAARTLIELLREMGEDGPRVIYVGNVYTLIAEDGKTGLELGVIQEDNPYYAMYFGQQLALDTFRRSEGVNWTVATPPRYLNAEGRTTEVRWASEEMIRNDDGEPAGISLEDYAYAVLQELEDSNYIRARFTVAR